MPIRIACPRCSASLTVSERGVGRTVKCLKCHQPMVVPELPADSVEPVIEELEYLPPPRPAPLKSNPVIRAWEDDRDDDDPPPPPPRRKKSNPRKSKGISPAIVVAMTAGIVLILGIGGTGIWLATRTNGVPKPIERIDLGVSSNHSETNEPESPKTVAVRKDPLPAGWSYNAPTLGFTAAWPVKAGADGFTPKESLSFGHSGTAGVSYTFAFGQVEGRGGALGVSSIVLPDVAIEPEQTLDNYVAKITRRVPATTVMRVTVYGRPGREVTYQVGNRTTVHRATIVNNVIWTAQADYDPKSAETARRFLDSLQAH